MIKATSALLCFLLIVVASSSVNAQTNTTTTAANTTTTTTMAANTTTTTMSANTTTTTMSANMTTTTTTTNWTMPVNWTTPAGGNWTPTGNWTMPNSTDNGSWTMPSGWTNPPGNWTPNGTSPPSAGPVTFAWFVDATCTTPAPTPSTTGITGAFCFDVPLPGITDAIVQSCTSGLDGVSVFQYLSDNGSCTTFAQPNTMTEGVCVPFGNVSLIAYCSSTTGAPVTMPSTTANPMMSSTTTPMMMNATTTTMTSSMAPSPMTPPPMSCEALDLYNCSLNTTCSIFNNSCVVSCTKYAMNDAAKCSTWSARCEMGLALCMPKCSVITMESACHATSLCNWYNGMCLPECKLANQNQCAMSPLCWWNATKGMCAANCARGVDDATCALSSTDCEWDYATKTCAADCWEFRESQANCESKPNCWFSSKSGSNYCYPKCGWAKTQMDCESHTYADGCQWSNGTCDQKCYYRPWNQVECEMNPMCKFLAGMCLTARCDMLPVGPNGCDHQSNDWSCQSIGGRCAPTCELKFWLNSSTCDNGCWLNQTSNMCQPLPCMNYTSEGDCTFRDECIWTSDNMCKPKCETANNDGAKCGMWAHCVWGSGKCWAVCSSLTTQPSCDSASANNDASNCQWDSKINKCTWRCQFQQNGMAGCTARTECQWVAAEAWLGCLPKCSYASTAQQCGSAAFTYKRACMWDPSQNLCVDNCAIRPVNTQSWTCPAPCLWNANYSLCVNPPPPTTSTTTGAATTTTTTTNGMMMNTTTTAPNTTVGTTTTTAAGTTTTAAQTTTAAATTTTTALSVNPAQPPPGWLIIKRKSLSPLTDADKAQIRNSLSTFLNLPSSLITVGQVDPVTGDVLVVLATDATVNQAAVTAAVQAAASFNSTQLNALGAASVVQGTLAPTTAAAPADDFPIAIVAGAAGGGVLLLIVIAVVAKKMSSGGDGQYLNDDRPGDQPMLNLPQMAAPQRQVDTLL